MLDEEPTPSACPIPGEELPIINLAARGHGADGTLLHRLVSIQPY